MTNDRLTVRNRLFLAFGSILGILVVLTVIATYKVGVIDSSLLSVSEQHAKIQRYAINFRGSAHDRSIAVRDVVLSGSPADRAREVATIEKLAAFYADSAGPLEKLISAPGADAELTKLYADIKAIEKRAVATTAVIVELTEKGDNDGAQSKLWAEAKPQYVEWLASINRLIDFEEARIQAENKIAMSEASGFRAVMLTALCLALAIGVWLALTIARRIQQQLGGRAKCAGRGGQPGGTGRPEPRRGRGNGACRQRADLAGCHADPPARAPA